MTNTETRYLRATHSSHLEVEADKPGDVDSIIAAGLAETMGILLTRLRGEWDAAAGDTHLYKRAQAEWVRLSRDAAAKAKQATDAAERLKKGRQVAKSEDLARMARDIDRHEAEAKRQAAESVRFLGEADREINTSRALILMNLRSLEPAKQNLFAFAVRQAPHKACSSTPEALGKLVGQVLDVWLDKLCHPCEGRGFNGGYGKARVMCPKCGGTGSRRNSRLGANAAEHAFGLWLLNCMDSRCNGSMKTVQRKTRLR